MENAPLLAERAATSPRASSSAAHSAIACDRPSSRREAVDEITDHDATSLPQDSHCLQKIPQEQEANIETVPRHLCSEHEPPQASLSSTSSGGTVETNTPDATALDAASSHDGGPAIEAVVTPGDSDSMYWTPIWLRRRSLLAFAALFICLATSLIVLWVVDNASGGFPLVLSTYHYAWTYGPTAILVCVLALWRQVDYHCKLIQPWQELTKGHVDAERSMLLDYLSPMHIISFVRAIRYRHAPVAASVAGFMVLKVIILLSAGLLILTPVQSTRPWPVTLNTRFDTKSFWDAVPDDSYEMNGGSGLEASYPNISSHPVYSYLKSLKGQDSGSVAGLVDDMVFQSFTPLPGPQLHDVSTEVDLFKPNISCEIAKLTTFTKEVSAYKLSGDFMAQLEAPTCFVGAEDPKASYALLPINTATNNDSESCGGNCSSWLNTHLWMVNCSKVGNDTSVMPLNAETSWDLRFALLVVNFTLGPSILIPNPSSKFRNSSLVKSNPELHQTAAVICDVQYSMQRSMVLNNLADDSFTIAHHGPMQGLNNLTGLMLGQMLSSSLYNYKDGMNAQEPFYELLLNSLNGQQTMDRFLAVETLQSSATQVWASLSAQFVRDSFLEPTTIETTATGTHVEDRLRVVPISLWPMVAAFVLMVALTLCIALTTHRNIVPRDIWLLSTDAATLAASWRLQDLLTRSGHLRTSQLSGLLHGYKFAAIPQDRFHITVTHKETLEQRPPPKAKARTWTPFAAKYPIILLTMAVPLSAIIVFEVLYRTSEASAGLMDVTGSEEVASYTSRYISAAVLLLVATCFSGLDFTIALFLPYSRLRSGPLPLRGGMESNTLGKIPLQALWLSIRYRDIGSFLAKFAALIGSILTIISSGLWIVDRNVIVQQSVEASVTNTWDLTWFNSSSTGDGGAGALFDDVQHGSAALPASIWREIVLPDIANIRLSFDTPAAIPIANSPGKNYTLQLNGVRPYLDCEIIADEYISISHLITRLRSPWSGVTARPPLPLGCQHAGPGGNESSYEFSVGYEPFADRVKDSFIMGQFSDLHLGPWESNIDAFDEYGPNENQRDNPAGCPSIGATFTFVRSANETIRLEDTTALLCSQKIQQVRLNVTYSGTDLANPVISSNTPPLLIETDSSTNLTNGTDGMDTFPYRVQTYLNGPAGNLTYFSYENMSALFPRLDRFIDHLMWGPNGMAAEKLLGHENRLVFKDAVQDLYARYMRHVIDLRFRQPVPHDKRSGDTTTSDMLVNGTAFSFTSRLQINRESKIALQAMLGAMIVLGTLAFVVTDLRGTLPRKPSFIASRMALLASSEMCREYAADERPDPTAEGWLFSLGWWREGREHGDQTGGVSGDETAPTKEEEGPEVRRFGVDIGAPEQLGFRDTKWRNLRRRRRAEAQN